MLRTSSQWENSLLLLLQWLPGLSKQTPQWSVEGQEQWQDVVPLGRWNFTTSAAAFKIEFGCFGFFLNSEMETRITQWYFQYLFLVSLEYLRWIFTMKLTTQKGEFQLRTYVAFVSLTPRIPSPWEMDLTGPIPWSSAWSLAWASPSCGFASGTSNQTHFPQAIKSWWVSRGTWRLIFSGWGK